MKLPLLFFLCSLGLLSSCSQHSASLPTLSALKKIRLPNPFDSKIPVRSVSAEELAAMEDYTIASYDLSDIPDGSLRPVNFIPTELPAGHDLLSASLLPSKSGESPAIINADGSIPEHKPIIPIELLDEDDSELRPLENIMNEEPLVPNAPQTVVISKNS